LAGAGLTGSGTEALLADVAADGSEQFYAHDLCTCSFAGRSGAVSILAVGTASAQGATHGIFEIIANGGGTGGAGLRLLAGWGTFVSAPDAPHTLRLIEHLGFG